MDDSAYKRYCELRDRLGYKDSDVATKAGITKSTFSDWKAGRYVPKSDKMEKIARVLNVSANYLMTGERDDDTRYYLNDETAKIAQEIFENKNLKILFDATRNAPPEDLQTVITMALALQKKGSDSDDTGC